MYLERSITDRLKVLVESFPVVVVSGARQVGKSTLVRHVFADIENYVVFDPTLDVENARQDPDLFLDNRKPPAILDEVQYAPEVVSAIKRRIDRDRSPGQYILTGSQQWHVLSSMAESLAGRAVFLDLEGLSLAEIAQSPRISGWIERWLEDPQGFFESPPNRLDLARTTYEQIWRGMLPEAQFLQEQTIADFHAAYQRTYIERDVRLLGDISDWQLFGRFVRLMGALTAQEMNYSQIGRELGLTAQTARRWLAMLQATFQWFELPAYSGNTIKRVSGKPKGHLADSGVACNALAISSPSALGGHPCWGALFETIVVGEIRKQIAAAGVRANLYHWRSHGGAEVDIVLEKDGVYSPMEVKASSHPGRGDARGLAAFRETYPHLNTAPGLIIAPCENAYAVTREDRCIPWDCE